MYDASQAADQHRLGRATGTDADEARDHDPLDEPQAPGELPEPDEVVLERGAIDPWTYCRLEAADERASRAVGERTG